MRTNLASVGVFIVQSSLACLLSWSFFSSSRHVTLKNEHCQDESQEKWTALRCSNFFHEYFQHATKLKKEQNQNATKKCKNEQIQEFWFFYLSKVGKAVVLPPSIGWWYFSPPSLLMDWTSLDGLAFPVFFNVVLCFPLDGSVFSFLLFSFWMVLLCCLPLSLVRGARFTSSWLWCGGACFPSPFERWCLLLLLWLKESSSPPLNDDALLRLLVFRDTVFTFHSLRWRFHFIQKELHSTIYFNVNWQNLTKATRTASRQRRTRRGSSTTHRREGKQHRRSVWRRRKSTCPKEVLVSLSPLSSFSRRSRPSVMWYCCPFIDWRCLRFPPFGWCCCPLSPLWTVVLCPRSHLRDWCFSLIIWMWCKICCSTGLSHYIELYFVSSSIRLSVGEGRSSVVAKDGGEECRPKREEPLKEMGTTASPKRKGKATCAGLNYWSNFRTFPVWEKRRRRRTEHHHIKEGGGASPPSPCEWWCFPFSSFGLVLLSHPSFVGCAFQSRK